MCCFSQPVIKVSNTCIFARMGSKGTNQLLAHSMHLEVSQKLAMILPIPVAKGTGENGVQFLNLEQYPHLFEDFAKGFPQPASRSLAGPFGAAPEAPQGTLKVVGVGAFEASFVPTIADFSRLDERFRLPTEIWQGIPAYADFGFAVFKLKAGNERVHPMAFSFPTATPEKLFFPTLHIHDGQIHAKDEFDHTLYCQGTGLNPKYWVESATPANRFIKHGLAQWLVHPERHVYRLSLDGLLDNGDVTAKIGMVKF